METTAALQMKLLLFYTTRQFVIKDFKYNIYELENRYKNQSNTFMTE